MKRCTVGVVTTVEQVRQQFHDALAELEAHVVLEHLKQELPSLSLRELGELLKSPMARSVASLPVSELFGSVSRLKAKA